MEYKLTYLHGAGNLETDWVTTTADRIDIVDPRRNLFTVHVIVAGNREEIQQIVVDLRYEDPDNAIFESQSWTLDSTTFDQAHDFVFPRADPARDVYTYSQVIVTTAGDVVSTGEVQSNAVHLLVGPLYAKRWVVQPTLVGPPLAQSGLDKITLELHYDDTANVYTSDKSLVLMQPGPGESWALESARPVAT